MSPVSTGPVRPTTPPTGSLGALRPVLDELMASTGVDEATLRALVEQSIAGAHARVFPEDLPVVAAVDLLTGAVRLQRRDTEGGEPLPIPLHPDVVRQSVHALKAGVASLLRDAERGRVVSVGNARRDELVDAIVERLEGRVWFLRVDGVEAILPPEEQLTGDVLERNQHLKVLVLDVRHRGRDAVLEVSRSHPNLLRRLLEQEVPELSTGQVVIRALVREAGRRSKVAVDAPGGVIDAEGACIGPRGVRIRAVCAELGDEQVHVVGWSSDPATYIGRAVGPAVVVSVDLDMDTRTAHCVVPDHQLSLAIGRAGENARLAARLTGWRIDIRGEGAA